MAYKLLRALLVVAGLAAIPACAAVYPPAYSAEAIEASVIDAETKQPLEGVVVTANWELRGGASPGGSTAVGQLMVLEAVTDKNGRFYFPAWGPIRQFKGELHNHDPKLVLFKSGYEYRILSNKSRFDAEAALEPMRRSQWSGKTIELQPFKGTAKEYAKRISSLMIDLRFIEDDCYWKQTPRMILELQHQSQLFESSGIVTAIYSVDYLPTDKAKCGSPKEFFRKYRP